jgi:hypothetical protein
VPTYSPGLDVAGPGLFALLGAGIAGTLIGGLLIVLVEALVLRFMGWGPFWRAFLSSCVMNLASFIVGVFYLGLLGRINGFVWVIGAYLLSVLVEAGVLALQRRAPFRRAVVPVVVSNLVTYLPVAALLAWGAAGLGL